jgi:SAM-dependent methyltransferase
MHRSLYDLQEFYKSDLGHVCQSLIAADIQSIWPVETLRGLRMVGVGYSQPYLTPYESSAERCVAVLPALQGASHWPSSNRNKTIMAFDAELPFETNSIDRLILIHSLEFSESLRASLQEFYRVLKSTGRILILLPNRLGFWARADWTPFGHGTPYTLDQIRLALKEHLYVIESQKSILAYPPLRTKFLMKSAPYIERLGNFCCSALCGLHRIEASKQLYAGTGPVADLAFRRTPLLDPALQKPKVIPVPLHLPYQNN